MSSISGDSASTLAIVETENSDPALTSPRSPKHGQEASALLELAAAATIQPIGAKAELCNKFSAASADATSNSTSPEVDSALRHSGQIRAISDTHVDKPDMKRRSIDSFDDLKRNICDWPGCTSKFIRRSDLPIDETTSAKPGKKQTLQQRELEMDAQDDHAPNEESSTNHRSGSKELDELRMASTWAVPNDSGFSSLTSSVEDDQPTSAHDGSIRGVTSIRRVRSASHPTFPAHAKRDNGSKGRRRSTSAVESQLNRRFYQLMPSRRSSSAALQVNAAASLPSVAEHESAFLSTNESHVNEVNQAAPTLSATSNPAILTLKSPAVPMTMRPSSISVQFPPSTSACLLASSRSEAARSPSQFRIDPRLENNDDPSSQSSKRVAPQSGSTKRAKVDHASSSWSIPRSYAVRLRLNAPSPRLGASSSTQLQQNPFLAWQAAKPDSEPKSAQSRSKQVASTSLMTLSTRDEVDLWKVHAKLERAVPLTNKPSIAVADAPPGVRNGQASFRPKMTSMAQNEVGADLIAPKLTEANLSPRTTPVVSLVPEHVELTPGNGGSDSHEQHKTASQELEPLFPQP
ncbi:hypothetical protein OIO90_000073 [Microbotryomycetes sp. JL221]|nr:hypothetical protein OIO90_000073 [Microbotryomycetes sp. JL221]